MARRRKADLKAELIFAINDLVSTMLSNCRFCQSTCCTDCPIRAKILGLAERIANIFEEIGKKKAS